MRIRSIKPEFWRSPDISALRIEDRLLFIGLWSFVDDNGVGDGRPGVVAADLFADDLSRDPRETLARVAEGLRRLFEAGRIERYTVENREFLAIVNWATHQRIDKPNKPRYPLPTCENAILARVSRDPRETSAPGTEERWEQGNSSLVADEIDDAEPGSALAVIEDERPEIEQLCERLADRIEANGSKRPRITKAWRDAARLMLDRDGRTPEQVAWLIDWCQQDEFWRSNVLSMPKLRTRFDQLRLKAAPRTTTAEARARDIIAMGQDMAREQAEQGGWTA